MNEELKEKLACELLALSVFRNILNTKTMQYFVSFLTEKDNIKKINFFGEFVYSLAEFNYSFSNFLSNEVELMKKFLSNNWKRIIYIVAAGFIIYNIILTILTKNTIIDDFYIYGQDYKKPSISINVNTDGIAGDEESIAKTISDKMVRRHPHVFGDMKFATEEELHAAWAEIKRKEKEGKEWQADYLPGAFKEAEELIKKAR